MTPKVSIIVPVFNVREYLEQSLESLVNQTLTDIEILCVDDCSTDGSLGLLNKYAAKDSRIKVIQMPVNSGQGAARNVAIDKAVGDYLMFLDPDDWLCLDACETAYNQAVTNGNDLCFFGETTYCEVTKQVVRNKHRIQPFLEHIQNPNIKLMELNKPFMRSFEVWWKIYRREFINQYHIRFSDERLGEDGEFGIRALINAETVSVIDKHLYNYRKRPNSASTKSYMFYAGYVQSKERCLKIILNHKYATQWLKSYLPYYVNALLYWYRASAVDIAVARRSYTLMRSVFIKLSRDYDMETLKEFYDYKTFVKVLKSPFKMKVKGYFKLLISLLRNKYRG